MKCCDVGAIIIFNLEYILLNDEAEQERLGK